MTDISARNAAFFWAAVFFRRLQQLGVRHVVISPGSRSTPLTLAAAVSDHFQKHVILDERSAAFTALGIGKATGSPAILISTSGTAVANYYPAVVEARQSGVPLILATADRPPHMRGTGANQAVDQLKIFGDYTVLFHEAGEPVMQEEDLDRLKMMAEQAVTASREQRGPVHLNFPFRKPLEPDTEFLQKTAEEINGGAAEPYADSGSDHVAEELVPRKEVTSIISQSKRPLMVLGPTAPGDDTGPVTQLADYLNCPILAEVSVGTDQHIISGYDAFLRDEKTRRTLSPDLVLRFGFQPTSMGLEIALKQWETDHHIHFASSRDWHDATFSSTLRISWLGRSLSIGELPVSTDANWIRQWKDTERSFRVRSGEMIEAAAELTDGHIYYHFTPQISPGHFISVSNSFPARDIQLFGHSKPGVPLFLNRGASGIDGITSSAMGVSIGLNKPGVLFTGDLAFLHDSNALLSHRILGQPLVIVVINNSGGSIFRMLPVYRHKRYFETYFETPQSADIGKLADTYDLPCYRISSLDDLHDFNLKSLLQEDNGVSIVECKTDADASMNLRNQLWGMYGTDNT